MSSLVMRSVYPIGFVGTVLMNEPNHIKHALLFASRDCNSHWENASTYEESRRIIIA